MKHQISLPDVARLAQVQRPAVSMWRRRYESSERPFPLPVTRQSGKDFFDVDEVLGWLDATGRTQGRDLRGDAAVYALPSGLKLTGNPAAFEGLAALLALKACTDAPLDGLTSEQLHALAVSADPHDTCVLREVQGVGADLFTLATYADELADAAYGPRAALEGLLAERFRHDATDLAATALAAPVHDLVVALAHGLALLLGAEDPAYLDPTGTGSDLLLSVVDAQGDPHADVLLTASEEKAARLFRRRAAARGLLLTPALAPLSENRAAVILAHYPVVGSPQMTTLEILDAVDDLALSMGNHHCAVVIAPAAALVDRLRDREAREAREQVLRTGRLRAALRLPAGLVTQRPRQSLGIWVLDAGVPARPVGERRVALGHLASPAPKAADITAIVDDVLASGSALADAHHYTHLSLVPTSTLLALSGSLIPNRRATSAGGMPPAALALRIADLSVEQTFPGPLHGLRVEATTDADAPLTTSLNSALANRSIRAISGNRAGFDVLHGGNVPVLGIPELTGKAAVGSRSVDRLTFLGAHAPSRLTDPGDVVFCTAPRPSALVDAEGGSAVQYPARILRVHPVMGEGLSPWVIASTIASQLPESCDWRRWTVPVLPPEQVAPTDRALSALEAQRQALRQRLAGLQTLTELMIFGVSSHALALHTTAPSEHSTKEGT